MDHSGSQTGEISLKLVNPNFQEDDNLGLGGVTGQVIFHPVPSNK
jgi:hypothetical protein